MIAHTPTAQAPRTAVGPARSPVVTLEHYARSVRAAHVSLWRVQGQRSLRAIAVYGVPFVGTGMQIPAAYDAHASRSPDEPLPYFRKADALGALARASGVDDVRAVPVHREDGQLAATLVVGWSSMSPAPDESVVLCRLAASLPAVQALVDDPDAPAPGVVVLHERKLVAHGIARALEASCALDVIASADIDHLTPALTDDRPWIVVCSDHLGAGASPAEVASRARELQPSTRLIVVANAITPASVNAARAADADGYATLEEGLDQLIDVLESVIAGKDVEFPEPQGAVLTPREQELLRGLEEGLTYHEIAVRQGVTLSTVKSQSRPLFRKLEVTSRGAAVHRARKDGLL